MQILPPFEYLLAARIGGAEAEPSRQGLCLLSGVVFTYIEAHRGQHTIVNEHALSLELQHVCSLVSVCGMLRSLNRRPSYSVHRTHVGKMDLRLRSSNKPVCCRRVHPCYPLFTGARLATWASGYLFTVGGWVNSPRHGHVSVSSSQLQLTEVKTTMARLGPQTPEGIATVTRNLPPPELSGPRTAHGKKIVSLNSVRHGLTIRGFLPCKKERCLYWDSCPLRRLEEGDRLLGEVDYGDDCPVEVGEYLDICETLGRELPIDSPKQARLIHSYAMAEVRIDRRRRYSSLEPNLVRQVPVDGTSFTRPSESLALKYQSSLSRERQRLIGELCILLNEADG